MLETYLNYTFGILAFEQESWIFPGVSLKTVSKSMSSKSILDTKCYLIVNPFKLKKMDDSVQDIRNVL